MSQGSKGKLKLFLVNYVRMRAMGFPVLSTFASSHVAPGKLLKTVQHSWVLPPLRSAGFQACKLAMKAFGSGTSKPSRIEDGSLVL